MEDSVVGLSVRGRVLTRVVVIFGWTRGSMVATYLSLVPLKSTVFFDSPSTMEVNFETRFEAIEEM